ncbi:MAG: hypothetical protein A3K18_08415 [Lentisphaerae bacterium RIFOXYA12_64_32]|nr:MAG: hypothetical protein A3K18_08415 [Lentisphaerae bacterium RIFOXYA12_64_32]
MLEIRKLPGVCWTAAYTKPRCEKVVSEYCVRHDMLCYLPLRRRAQRYQRRTVETFLPLFPGYVFVQVPDTSKAVLLQSHKVVSVLPIDGVQQENLIRELNELQHLEQLQLTEELVVQPELVPGRPVLIVAGPLRGLTGIVERRRQKARVSINVEILGQSVSTELDLGEVKLADE